jgi:hypothetical protein
MQAPGMVFLDHKAQRAKSALRGRAFRFRREPEIPLAPVFL